MKKISLLLIVLIVFAACKDDSNPLGDSRAGSITLELHNYEDSSKLHYYVYNGDVTETQINDGTVTASIYHTEILNGTDTEISVMNESGLAVFQGEVGKEYTVKFIVDKMPYNNNLDYNPGFKDGDALGVIRIGEFENDVVYTLYLDCSDSQWKK